MREQGLRSCQSSIASTQNSKILTALKEMVHRAARLIHSSCSGCLLPHGSKAQNFLFQSSPAKSFTEETTGKGRSSPEEAGLQKFSPALGISPEYPLMKRVLGKVCRPQQTTTLSTLRKEHLAHQQHLPGGNQSDKSAVRA